MEPWPAVGAEAVAEMALGLRRRFFGANARPVLLLPGITLGLAFLRASLDLRLFPLLDVLSKLFVGLAAVLRSRRPRPSGIHDQSFAQPRFAI